MALLQGSGTAGDPFLIQSVRDFFIMRQGDEYPAGHTYFAEELYFKQTVDLDFTGVIFATAYAHEEWWNTYPGYHMGFYDCNNKKWSNITFSTGLGWYDWETSLLSPRNIADGYTIKDLTIENMVARGNNRFTSFEAYQLFGNTELPTFRNIQIINVDIDVYDNASPFYAFQSNYYNCNVTGKIKSLNQVGGFHYEGGYFGQVIENCHVNAEVESTSANAYGFMRQPHSATHIKNCSFTGKVKANNIATGFIMGMFDSALIEGCFVSAEVNGEAEAYGFVEFVMDSLVKNCYFVGSVASQGIAVGFVKGTRSGQRVVNCYSAATISAPNKEGFVYWEQDDPELLDYTTSYFDTDVSGIVTAKFNENPRTTAEMKTESTFTGWDFNTIWKLSSITNGYPALQWQQGSEEYIPNYPPQSYVELNFTAGDSTPYPMGRFFIDRTQFSVGRETVSVQARNSIGKYIKDQSFDERHYYPTATLKTLLEQILLAAGITNYHVANNSTQVGMEFPPNMDMLTGIQELLKLTPGWIIREEVSGKVVIGPRNDVNFTQPSKYTFYRDQDIFSRESIKDDNDAYGRVCCHTADYSVRVYRPVPSTLGWLPPAQKTFYVPVPDGTRSAEAASLAVELAEQMANSGEVETFVGPHRPHLIPGDQAEIVDAEGPNLLGIITTVEHAWSKGGQGFITGITVDSGGKIGKPQLREFIDALAGRQKTGAVKL